VTAAVERQADVRTCLHRHEFIVVESVVAVGALAGTWQLVTGTGTPPVSDLAPLGLTTWVLPGVWLFVSVAVPSSVAAWMAWRRAAGTPATVLTASAALGVELVVQLPFVGASWFQPAFGVIAIWMAASAARARLSQTWTGGPRRPDGRLHEAGR
jgi:hypothetical protein